jgi:hypothetical protein
VRLGQVVHGRSHAAGIVVELVGSGRVAITRVLELTGLAERIRTTDDFAHGSAAESP